MDSITISAVDEPEYIGDTQMLTDVVALPALAETQSKQLELLQHLSRYSELLILLSAERGMGKTFIAQALLTARELPDLSLMIEADISLSYLDVLNQLADVFALAPSASDIETLESQIITHCLELSNNQQSSMLLIVDQADQLPDEVLEDLSHLALLAPDALRIILISPPGLEQKLSRAPEPQAPVHIMNIEPLTDEEAKVLLLKSFSAKNWANEEINYILQQCAGSPGKILYIAQELLSGKKISDSSKFPITHIVAVVFVLAISALAYLYYSDSSEELTEEMIEPETKIEPIEAISALENPPTELVERKSVDNVDKKESAPARGQQAAPILEDEEIDFNFPQSNQEVAVEKVHAKEVVAVETVTNKTTNTETKQVEQPVKKYSNDEKMLLAHADSGFVMQIFGSFSEKNAQSFIKKYSNKEISLSTYKTIHQEKPWHVVVAGPYESREIAVAKSTKLPKSLQQQKPWIRSIVPVKEQITSFR